MSYNFQRTKQFVQYVQYELSLEMGISLITSIDCKAKIVLKFCIHKQT